jgi:hypothetical protein
MLYTFIFGPYILFKIRKLDDAYHWALQTKIAIVSGYVSQQYHLTRTATSLTNI